METLYGWKSNFTFPHHPIPDLCFQNIVYILLLSLFIKPVFSFLKPNLPSRHLFPADSSLVAFLPHSSITSPSLVAAGSFPLLAKYFWLDVSSCRGTWVFWLSSVFSDSSDAASSLGSRGKKSSSKSAVGHLGQCTWNSWRLSPFLRYAACVLNKHPGELSVLARPYWFCAKRAEISPLLL